LRVRSEALFHACAARFRKPDGDSLFRVGRAMLPFANVVHFFADELAGFSAWRFTFLLVSPGLDQ
jgi:hypothetical protein